MRPRPVRWTIAGALAVELVVGVSAAAVRASDGPHLSAAARAADEERAERALRSLVIDAPAGWNIEDDEEPTVAQVAQEFQQPAATTKDLESAHYLRGVEVLYGNPGDTHRVQIQMWEFATDADALSIDLLYRQSNYPGAVIDTQQQADGVPGGYLYTFDRAAEPAHGVLLRGVVSVSAIVIHIDDIGPVGSNDSASLTSMLLQQYQKVVNST